MCRFLICARKITHKMRESARIVQNFNSLKNGLLRKKKETVFFKVMKNRRLTLRQTFK